jgi:hypothetical protein
VADHLASAAEVQRDAVTALARARKPGDSPADTQRLNDALLASIDEHLADRGKPPTTTSDDWFATSTASTKRSPNSRRASPTETRS